jgi:hypothetical protein
MSRKPRRMICRVSPIEISFTARSLRSLEPSRTLSILFIVFSSERGENTMNQALHTDVGQALPRRDSRPTRRVPQKQQNHFEMVEPFIRIPLSGILIKMSFSAFFATPR